MDVMRIGTWIHSFVLIWRVLKKWGDQQLSEVMSKIRRDDRGLGIWQDIVPKRARSKFFHDRQGINFGYFEVGFAF
jgi:hypothetical protein